MVPSIIQLIYMLYLKKTFAGISQSQWRNTVCRDVWQEKRKHNSFGLSLQAFIQLGKNTAERQARQATQKIFFFIDFLTKHRCGGQFSATSNGEKKKNSCKTILGTGHSFGPQDQMSRDRSRNGRARCGLGARGQAQGRGPGKQMDVKGSRVWVPGPDKCASRTGFQQPRGNMLSNSKWIIATVVASWKCYMYTIYFLSRGATKIC